uniref:Uncharacterized protein n=1 Tax=Panagrellus redivivus TaxID=6233 RepID=A0A7E4WCG1_PANRE
MRFSYILIPIVCLVSLTRAINDDYYRESDYQPEYRGFRHPFVGYQYGRGRQSTPNLRQNRYNSPVFSGESLPEQPENVRDNKVDVGTSVTNGLIQGATQSLSAMFSDLLFKLGIPYGLKIVKKGYDKCFRKINDTTEEGEWKAVIRTNGTHYFHTMEDVPFMYATEEKKAPSPVPSRNQSPAGQRRRQPPSPRSPSPPSRPRSPSSGSSSNSSPSGSPKRKKKTPSYRKNEKNRLYFLNPSNHY